MGNIFPKDSVENARFAVNFFTSIGLGALTVDLREFIADAPNQLLKQKYAELLAQAEAAENEDDSSSSSSDSSSGSSNSSSDSDSDDTSMVNHTKNHIKAQHSPLSSSHAHSPISSHNTPVAAAQEIKANRRRRDSDSDSHRSRISSESDQK